MKEKSVLVYKTNGQVISIKDMKGNVKKPTLEELQSYVGGYIEVVKVKIDGEAYCLVVDEEGLIKKKAPNWQISQATGVFIVGDAVLIKGYRL